MVLQQISVQDDPCSKANCFGLIIKNSSKTFLEASIVNQLNLKNYFDSKLNIRVFVVAHLCVDNLLKMEMLHSLLLV